MKNILVFIAMLFVLCFCENGKRQHVPIQKEEDSGMAYARWFSIENQGDFQRLRIMNPADNHRVFQEFLLAKNGVKIPDSQHNKTKVIRIPVKSLAVMSLDNIGYLSLLDALNKVAAVTDENRIFNPEIKEQLASGFVISLGPAINPDKEKLLTAGPELILATTYQQKEQPATGIGGIPVIYNLDWLEQSPLGRAEWIKLLGALLDREEKADSVFRFIEHHYQELKREAMLYASRPKVMTGAPYKGIWYMPGNKSYKARLIRDAGGDYSIPGDSSTGSVALALEQAVQYFNRADVWIEAPWHSLSELKAADSRLTIFKPVRKGRVYNNKRRERGQANDYWEQGVCRPDLLLKDMITVLHQRQRSDNLMFYKKLEDDER